jgi:hypothetical protein
MHAVQNYSKIIRQEIESPIEKMLIGSEILHNGLITQAH